ncbi:MAG: efflux transporter outer membrane subunit [Rickettsiales bacterium]
MRDYIIERGLAPYAPSSLTTATSGSPWKAKRRKMLLLGVMLLPLTACDLAPDLKLPEVFTPSAFKEDTSAETVTVEPATDGKWKRFDEKAQIEEFAWWRMFNDSKLDALMDQAMKDNPSLDIARERVNSARAVVDTRAADLYPSISAGIGPQRTRPSAAAQEVSLPPGITPTTKPYNLYTAQGSITYELDLFGQTRARVKAAEKDAEAEQNNYRAARLALQTEIVQAYFRVAALRAENKILTDTVATRDKYLELTRKRHEVGEIDSLVLSSAETDRAAVKSDATVVAQNLAVSEHALATLIGVPSSELKVETADLSTPPPTIPAGIPSSLLERRPDIKQAESLIAAANQRIGVARGGYFPDISLSAVGGFVSGDLGDLFKWSNRTWTIGPLAGTVITQPIFEGGRIAAAKAQTQADFNAATATYRESVLTAFREVEDQLSGIRNLSEQTKAVDAGLSAATRANKVAGQRFDAGYTSHLEYLDAQRSYLAAQRAQVQVRGNQYITTVQLVKALGGSWQAPAKPETIAPQHAAPIAAPETQQNVSPAAEDKPNFFEGLFAPSSTTPAAERKPEEKPTS